MQGIFITRYVLTPVDLTFEFTSLKNFKVHKFQGELPVAKLRKYITQPFLCFWKKDFITKNSIFHIEF